MGPAPVPPSTGGVDSTVCPPVVGVGAGACAWGGTAFGADAAKGWSGFGFGGYSLLITACDAIMAMMQPATIRIVFRSIIGRAPGQIRRR